MGIFFGSRRPKTSLPPEFPVGTLTDILNDFLNVHQDALRDIFIRGQDAHVINQTDINAVRSPVAAILQQRLQVLSGEVSSLKQETSVLVSQLAIPLDLYEMEHELHNKGSIVKALGALIKGIRKPKEVSHE
jgi:hypothetical protein